jgi:hypothetical protein
MEGSSELGRWRVTDDSRGLEPRGECHTHCRDVHRPLTRLEELCEPLRPEHVNCAREGQRLRGDVGEWWSGTTSRSVDLRF